VAYAIAQSRAGDQRREAVEQLLQPAEIVSVRVAMWSIQR
jgi:hypothetical protein